MHCSACSTAVEAALEGTAGVSKASVSLTLSMADVTYNPKLCDVVRARKFMPGPAGANVFLVCVTFQQYHFITSRAIAACS